MLFSSHRVSLLEMFTPSTLRKRHVLTIYYGNTSDGEINFLKLKVSPNNCRFFFVFFISFLIANFSSI